MTPRLCTPSTFRALRVAVVPPVLMTTALLCISAAYGVPPGHGLGPSYGLRPASYTVQPAPGAEIFDAAAQPAHLTRSTYPARRSAAPPPALAHTSGHTASVAAPSGAREHGHSVTVAFASPLGHQASGPSRLWPPMPALPIGAFPLANRTSALLGLISAPGHKTALPAAGAPASGHSAARLSAAEPSPGTSRAGSVAGEGRERPGRPDAEPQNEANDPTYTDADPTTPQDQPSAEGGTGDASPDTGIEASADAVGPAASSPAPSKDPAVLAREAATSESVVEILPLGSGLVLVGTGLALALLALRLRRE